MTKTCPDCGTDEFDGLSWRQYMHGIEHGNIDPTGERLRAVCRLAREALASSETDWRAKLEAIYERVVRFDSGNPNLPALKEVIAALAAQKMYVGGDIASLQFELQAARNEIEIADGEIERLRAALAATPAVGGEAKTIDQAVMKELGRQHEAGVKYLSGLNVDDLVAAIVAAQPAPPLRGRVTDEMVERAVKIQNLELIQGFTYKTRHVIRDFRTDEGTELWSSPLGFGSHNAMMKRIEFIKMQAALEAALSASAETARRESSKP